MQQSQRAEHNPALEYAVQRANERRAPLLVVFGLMDDFPEANLRHYRFMVEGLRETRQALEDRGIRMIVRHGHPAEVAFGLARNASLVVCDRGYLRPQKAWRRQVADEAGRQVVQVESDVVVPVDTASDKAEYAARTIRSKLRRHWDRFRVDIRTTQVKRDSLGLKIEGLDVADVDAALAALKLDRSVAPNPDFVGGTKEAKRLFRRFLDQCIPGYDDHRKRPETDYVSHMSKYLHFGQISPVWLALRVREAAGKPEGDRNSFLDELLVRRELSQNFCEHTPDYDRYSCLPEWARATLKRHRSDRREHVYTQRELEDAQTHDPYWNAAMREMRYTGYMHNYYMRMYWGKKILEWTNTPEHAHRVALALNNKYFIDGRDANSFANVNWCFGLHDRPWPERPIFGKIRYMAASGLKRKADPEAYIAKVDRMVRRLER